MDYYIVNLSHLRRDQLYVAVWRPDCSGYAWPLSWAGKYPEEEVRKDLDYFNDGCVNIAVPCEVLDAMAVVPEKGWIDNDAGPVVRNIRENWKRMLESVIAPTKHQSWPEYPRAPRKPRKIKEAA